MPRITHTQAAKRLVSTTQSDRIPLIKRDRLTVADKLQPFALRRNLSDTGKTRAKMAKSHVQRPAVQLRYGKAQLVIFPPASAQRSACSESTAQHRIGVRHGIEIDTCAAAAGFENMAQIGDQAVGEIDSRCRRSRSAWPCSTRGIGRR